MHEPAQHHTTQVALCEQLVQETWAGAATLFLNAAFCGTGGPNALGIPVQHHDFVNAITTAWCFQPGALLLLLGVGLSI